MSRYIPPPLQDESKPAPPAGPVEPVEPAPLKDALSRGFQHTFSYMGITDLSQLNEEIVRQFCLDTLLSPLMEYELRETLAKYVDVEPPKIDGTMAAFRAVYDAIPLILQFPVPTPGRITRRFGKVSCYPWRYIEGELRDQALWQPGHKVVEKWNALGLPGKVQFCERRGFLSEVDGDNKLVFRVTYDNPSCDPRSMFNQNRTDTFCFIVFSERGKTYFSDCNPTTDGHFPMSYTEIRFPYIRQWLECVQSIYGRIAPFHVDTALGVGSAWDG